MKKLFSFAIAECFILFIASCGGSPSQSGTSTAPVAAVVSGAEVYNRTCIACHQAGGAGIPNTYPPLAKSDFLADKEKTITQVIKGYQGELVVNGVKYNNVMPAQQLNDDEIAAVLSYVNTSFGNNGSLISATDVKAVRAKLN